MPGGLKAVVLLLCIGAAICASPAAAAPLAPADESRRIVDLINDARQTQGLHPLTHARPLMRSSARFATKLMQDQRFGHAPLIEASPSFLALSELLSKHGGRNSRPSATVSGWIRSPLHRGLVLSPAYRYAGGGIARGAFLGRASVIWAVQLGAH